MGEWSSSRKRPRMHQKDAGWPIRASKYGGLPPPSVPPWEIRFCSQISWTKFCEDKKLTYLFENVLNWDDSAGKESFDNAKARYWAEMNGRRCDIPSPDPDMYIDAVNQHTFLDPRLVEDLYKPPPPSASPSPSPPPHKAAPDYNSIEIIPTGWDVEDPCTSGATIPIYILAVDDQSPAKPSRCGRAEMPILGSGEPVTIVPTGWGDEGEVRSSNARKLSGIHSNDAPWSEIREESSWEHSECWNGRKYGSWGNGGGVGRRFGSKPATARGEEECFRASDNSGGFRGRRKNHTDEYSYWHGCAATGYHQR